MAEGDGREGRVEREKEGERERALIVGGNEGAVKCSQGCPPW